MSTKLGPHVLWSAPDLSEYIQAGIAVAKFAGNWGMASDVPDGVLVIGRLVVDEQDYTAQKQKKVSHKMRLPPCCRQPKRETRGRWQARGTGSGFGRRR